MKRCSKCKKRKDESKFNKNRKSKDGLGYPIERKSLVVSISNMHNSKTQRDVHKNYLCPKTVKKFVVKLHPGISDLMITMESAEC